MLVLIALAIGIFFWLRARRQRRQGLQLGREYGEENIPLHSNRAPSPNGHRPDDEEFRQRKGKGRADADVGTEGEPIFNVGDSDGEEDGNHRP